MWKRKKSKRQLSRPVGVMAAAVMPSVACLGFKAYRDIEATPSDAVQLRAVRVARVLSDSERF